MIEAPPDPHVCKPSANPRRNGNCDCGRSCTRPRNIELGKHITQLAAQSAGFVEFDEKGKPVGNTFGLSDYAEARAWPGGVRLDLDLAVEALQEYADARNYHVWAIEMVYEQYLEGEPEAVETYERHMRALSFLLRAWHALLTPAA